MPDKVRRIVTGHRPDGTSIVEQDAETPKVFGCAQRPGYAISEVWLSDRIPAPLDGVGDPTDRERTINPPPGGTIFRIAEFPPEAGWIANFDPAKARNVFAAMGSADAHRAMENPPHPMMHQTKTLDYAVVLSGEIYLVLDDSETLLKTGDVVVQRGTNHAWSNRSDEPCRMAFILVDGAGAA